MTRSGSSSGSGCLRGAKTTLSVALGAWSLGIGSSLTAAEPPPRLRVSDTGRGLVTESGAPFFWLGDTCWRMMTKAVLEDARDQPSVLRYFDARAAGGFNVIQTVILAGDGREGNAYGQLPFTDRECVRPSTVDGPLNDYWDMTDWLIDQAGARGLYLALLPVWLQDLDDRHPWVTEPGRAYAYGRFLGARYRSRTHLVWVLGGDAGQKGRNVDVPSRLALVRAVAEGIADGGNGAEAFDGKADWTTTLMTFHPPGRAHSSSEWLHGEPWPDFKGMDACWFDPRTGCWWADDKESGLRRPAVPGVASGSGAPAREFVPPGGPGDGNDWVLVLAARTP